MRGRRLAVDYSPEGAIPYLDGIPAGVAELLRGLGATLVPSAELVTRYCSVWTADDVASHRRAAEAIASIARDALALAGAQVAHRPADERARSWPCGSASGSTARASSPRAGRA